MKPAIRLFISSTFLDMQEERFILNQEVFPLIRKKCADYGVSFYAVDLRWGITKEDQDNNEVISLCLKEINNCTPFFLGLIGNRYGWIPLSYDEKLIKEFPWIANYQGKSVTELEMILGAINNPEKDKTIFLFKDSSLTKEKDCDHKDELLNDLKERIYKNDIYCKPYSSMEEFKTVVTEKLLAICENYLQINKSINLVRQEYFLDCIEEKYVYSHLEDNVFEILEAIKNNHKPLVVYGEKNWGITTTFSHVINSLQGNKIIINLEADDEFKYSFVDKLYYHLYHELVNQKLSDLVLSDEDDLDVSIGQKRIIIMKNISRWISKIKTSIPLYILINDISQIYQTDGEMFFMNIFPEELPDNVYVILTTSDYFQAFYLNPYTIVTVNKMNGFGKEFFISYLAYYGKKMDTELLKAYDYFNPDDLSIYEVIADYAINYTNFDTYKETLYKFIKVKTLNECYKLTFDLLSETLTEKQVVYFKFILLKLFYAQYGLEENELFDNLQLTSRLDRYDKFNIDEYELTGIDKKYISRAVKFFCDLKSDRFTLNKGVLPLIKECVDAFRYDIINYQKENIKKIIDNNYQNIKIYNYLDTSGNNTFMDKETLTMVFTNDNECLNALDDDLVRKMFINKVNNILNYFEKMTIEALYQKIYVGFDSINTLAEINQIYTLFTINHDIENFGRLFQNTFLMVYLYNYKKPLFFKMIISFCIQNHNIKGFDTSIELYTTKYYLYGIFDKAKYQEFLENEYTLIVGETLRIVSSFGYDDYLKEEFAIEFYALNTLDYQILVNDLSYETYELYSNYLDDIDVDINEDEYYALMNKDLTALMEIYNSNENKPIIYWFIVLDLISIIVLEVNGFYNSELYSYIKDMEQLAIYSKNPYLMAEYNYKLGYFYYSSGDYENALKYLQIALNAFYYLGEYRVQERINSLINEIKKD